MKYIRIAGWEKYQHYKDRNPPWIKLHRELLTSNTWVTLDDAGRVLAIAIMMLAAATGNKIPAQPGYVRRVAYLNDDPDFAPLVEVGFIEIIEENPETASAPLAPAIAPLADARPETEQSRDREEKKEPAPAALEAEFESWWKVYPKKDDKGHARKEFIKARKRGTPLETLLAGAERYRDDPKRDPKFTKNAGTWLTGECWGDEGAVAPPGPEPVTPEQKEANRLATLVWAIERGMVNIANNYPTSDVRKLLAAGKVTQEQCAKIGILVAA